MKPIFAKAFVRRPCQNMVNGLAQVQSSIPDYNNAILQHQEYIDALTYCGLEVIVLPADEDFPDSTFIEDTALLTPDVAIITHPGASSRKGETTQMRGVLEPYFNAIETIVNPGTIEAGDIMMVGSYFYIGLSGRTNIEGARQMLEILRSYGMDGTTVALKEFLHLKSGLSYLEENRMLIGGEFLQMKIFENFKKIPIPIQESYASNSLWINDRILVPQGYPITLDKIKKLGFETIVLDVSEFRKLDGGLSCLSLRF